MPDRIEPPSSASPSADSCVRLYWIPLGSGQHVVRLSGKTFEAMSAWLQHRRRCDLYHAALVVTLGADEHSIEVAPIPDGDGARRGVVGEGPVGVRWLGRFRLFRYEVRCWRNGSIPDLVDATDIVDVAIDPAAAERLLESSASIPTPVWGRDELRAGEMWNSNSVVAWLLTRAGVDTSLIALPISGRAPGWDAGRVVALRTLTRA